MKKTVFWIELTLAILATLGKLYFVVRFRNADQFDSFSVRLLWEQMVINPMLLFLWSSVTGTVLLRWRNAGRAGSAGNVLGLCCMALFLLYYVVVVLHVCGLFQEDVSVLLFFLQNSWIFVALGISGPAFQSVASFANQNVTKSEREESKNSEEI
ncbi:MAG: hypothetical protein VB055_03970 [Oscillospiraceae bacterium]|nr:hypothetical protein [Oscillospiraceae bacterium]